VTIFGTGFSTGAKATWSLAGDTTQVHVKSTKVVSSTQLTARIVVPATAPLASYDVEVTLLGGKKGVGAEMFEVLLGDPKAEFWFPTDDPHLGLRGDGLFLNGTSSVYAGGVLRRELEDLCHGISVEQRRCDHAHEQSSQPGP
jgi:hypothetical protein